MAPAVPFAAFVSLLALAARRVDRPQREAPQRGLNFDRCKADADCVDDRLCLSTDAGITAGARLCNATSLTCNCFPRIARRVNCSDSSRCTSGERCFHLTTDALDDRYLDPNLLRRELLHARLCLSCTAVPLEPYAAPVDAAADAAGEPRCTPPPPPASRPNQAGRSYEWCSPANTTCAPGRVCSQLDDRNGLLDDEGADEASDFAPCVSRRKLCTCVPRQRTCTSSDDCLAGDRCLNFIDPVRNTAKFVGCASCALYAALGDARDARPAESDVQRLGNATPPSCDGARALQTPPPFAPPLDALQGAPSPPPLPAGTVRLGASRAPCSADDDCAPPRRCLSVAPHALTPCAGGPSCECGALSARLCATSTHCLRGDRCAVRASADAYAQRFCVGASLARGSGPADAGWLPVDARAAELLYVLPVRAAALDGAACVATRHLEGVRAADLVFERARTASVLCDAAGSCATAGHVVDFYGTVQTMAAYCAGHACTRARIQVNSPRMRRGVRVASRTRGLRFTALSTRFGVGGEAAVVTWLARLGF